MTTSSPASLACPTGGSFCSTKIPWEHLLQQSRGILPELIQDALGRGGVPTPASNRTRAESNSAAPPLLQALIYEYAVGNFAASDILADWGAGKHHLEWGLDPVPDLASLLSFRRRSRPLLRACLSHLLVLVWLHQVHEPDPFDGNPQALWEQAEGEAQRRLEWAQFGDLLDRE